MVRPVEEAVRVPTIVECGLQLTLDFRRLVDIDILHCIRTLDDEDLQLAGDRVLTR